MNLEYSIKFNRDNEWEMVKHHFHEDIEILFSLTEAGSFFANGKLYPLKRGTIIISENTVLHRTIANECDIYERYAIHFPKDTLKEISTEQSNIMSVIGDDIQCIQLEENEIRYMVDILENCKNIDNSDFGSDLINDSDFDISDPYGESNGLDFYSDLRKDICFIELMLKICDFIGMKKKIKFLNNSGFNKVNNVLEYIQNHLSEDLSLDFLAEHFFMSKYHLIRTFKAVTGFTIVEYITNCRILKARELLRKSHSVQIAGELAGFKNNAHFIRTFGKISGETPGKYMRRYRDSKKE